ncbi:UNVERIFIED_ORG: iron complex outermembrane receptor protein [Idiomarina abyssalis]|uniref:TonB-dependent siderophore receptor n=1 Tax=Idiomarina sp. 017G TaxID=2183988 RepID=UPI000E0F88ED|nr:TonB-dependent siderophore receptor [Idiomarina sp. 017G]TDO45204.1 iron complex outermembrane receptor protein [Idiomarina sp. 017G]
MKYQTVTLSLLSIISMGSFAQEQESFEHIEVNYRQAYRGDVPVSEIPQAITTLDRSLVDDINISRFRDILLFSPSIALQNDGGNLWDSYSMRGFPGNENVPTGYLVNGFSSGRGFGGHRDVSNIEYVEVLKGPGSALYGRSDPGGVINVVTRKPQYAPEGYLKTSLGSDDRYRIEGDYTSGLSDSLAMRINGAIQDDDSFRDHVSSKKKVINPSLRWQLDKDTSILYSFEFMQQEQLFDRGIVVLDNNIKTVPRERFLGEPSDDPTKINSQGHQLTFEHYLQNDWFLTGGINARSTKLDGYSSDAELSGSRQKLFEDGRTLTRQHRRRDYDSDDLSVRLELSGNTELFGMTHHLLMGADAYRYDLYTLLARARPEPGTYELDIFNPQYGAAKPELQTQYINDENQKGFGLYVQDQLELNDQWHLLLGLRLDQYTQETLELVSGTESEQDDSRVSPRVALSYLPTDNLTLYASYSEGFVPISGTDFEGQGFDPEESDSVELGMKYSAHGFRLNAAVFDATKTNILTDDPAHPGYPATLGAATSRGFEIEGGMSLGSYTDLQVAYSYIDSETKNDITVYDWGVNVPAGSDLVNIPQNTFNAMVKHDLRHWQINADIGLTARYVDDRLGATVDQSYRLPSYQVFDLFYTHRLTDNTELQINVDNLFDEYYMSNAYSALWTTPGAPRQFSVSLTYEF